MSVVVETAGLTKDYGFGRGVHDVTLAVASGQIFGFLGPNGAGKSTFVKMMVGLIRPTSGSAAVFGQPVEQADVRRRIGYLPELFRYQEWLTAAEVLRYHARLCRMPGMRAERRIDQVLADVGLSAHGHERVKRFSKGMQQRLGVACALLDEPDLVFLDEPSSALDPLGRHDMLTLLQRLAAQGRTVFLNTHLLEDVQAVCSEVALLWAGRIRAQGRVAQILGQRLAWRFAVGGWTAELAAALAADSGIVMRIEGAEPDGSARLSAELADREWVGYVNDWLVRRGVTVYEVERVQNSMTDWFIAQAQDAAGGGGP